MLNTLPEILDVIVFTSTLTTTYTTSSWHNIMIVQLYCQ